MISKEEIISVATAQKLLATTVEKDYALSWVLSGVAQNDALSKWIFKGGTCLKKCYFETYRFSEDLDFTVPSGAIYGEAEIKNALSDLADAVYDAAGIEIKKSDIDVEVSKNKKGAPTFFAKLTYLGPLNLAARQQQRIKFDITDDEIISDIVDTRDVFHAYSDAPDPASRVKCYSINEILAEKTRALYQRQGRARDVYDVVNISRSFREDVNIERAASAVKEKFRFKEIDEPTVDLVMGRIDFAQLQGSWDEQLSHQLQMLPPVSSFFDDLRPALEWWISPETQNAVLPSISPSKAEVTIPRVHFPQAGMLTRSPLGLGRGAINPSLRGARADYLDQLRYAARNRLCVEINYHGVIRLVEPYSLRRPSTGNLLLYVYELQRGGAAGGGIKAYKIAEIANVEVTQRAYVPRYIVEL